MLLKVLRISSVPQYFQAPCPLGLGTVVKECLVTLLRNLATLNYIGKLEEHVQNRYIQEKNALSANCVLSCLATQAPHAMASLLSLALALSRILIGKHQIAL